jgi:hypothetical protein
MKGKLHHICLFLALLCVLAVPVALRADTITYTFTSEPNPPAPNVTSFSFSYTGTDLISISSTFMPVDDCTVVVSLTSDRVCETVELSASGAANDRIKLLKNGGNEFQITLPIGLFASVGTNTDGAGDTLTITDVADVPAVPEPGAVTLFGTGVLGLAGVVRRRVMG